MPQNQIQSSFNSGVWSPKLYGRVDLTKYHSGAALLDNWFVDYRGGASTRPGTAYVAQCYKGSNEVRLIPFQASFETGYVLEFGHGYIRFFYEGGAIIQPYLQVTAMTRSPITLTVPGNQYVAGDWIYIQGSSGATPRQLMGQTFKITNVLSGSRLVLGDTITDISIDGADWPALTGNVVAGLVHTIPAPYAAPQLKDIKFTQSAGEMILCHPNYPPYVLRLISPTLWTLLPLTIGTSISTPTAPTITIYPGDPAGKAYYSYVVTAIDALGQESKASFPGVLGPNADMRVANHTVKIAWPAVQGAVSYNVYKGMTSYFGPAVTGDPFGYIGTTNTTSFSDANIAANFSQTPPVNRNPFAGRGVSSVTVTNGYFYTSVPSVSFTNAISTTVASASAILQTYAATITAGGSGFREGDTVSFTNDVVLTVSAVDANGSITAWNIGAGVGNVVSGNTPPNPVLQLSTSGSGTGAQASLSWRVGQVVVNSPGSGYAAPPTVVFSPGGATAVAQLSPAGGGNPTVPGFFQQRLVLAAPKNTPQTIYLSRPGQYNNFDTTAISQDNDSIVGTLVSGQLNTIKAMIPQPAGLLIFTDRNSWLITGGASGAPISPSHFVANTQSYNGISDVPPIIANFDILYVQAKGSIVRDSIYNIYSNVFSGSDISTLASHLFYGHTIKEWAWAEEPFKLVWAVRDDGVMLILTFLKEQEFVAWTSASTPGGLFKSIVTVTENTTTAGEIDAIYTVVQRTVKGRTVNFIERISERIYKNGVEDARCVDCGIYYNGTASSMFYGATPLAGQTVTGLADGKIITPFVMPDTGIFTLPAPASKVTIGIGYNCDLQTLPLDTGEPTILGEPKKINFVDILVDQTLGLEIGASFTKLTPMKDLTLGNVSSMLTGQENQKVTGLVSGQARTFLNPSYTIPGQYCIRQSSPYPASVLAVIPNITDNDSNAKSR